MNRNLGKKYLRKLSLIWIFYSDGCQNIKWGVRHFISISINLSYSKVFLKERSNKTWTKPKPLKQFDSGETHQVYEIYHNYNTSIIM